uniref:PHB domain-containing protein n=1 Tax=Elaeophora elaphi TaxID=1147741 RepID=A0A0R3RU85_9BILA
MPEEKVGWIKAARRILVQCCCAIIEDILERKRILLSSLLKWRIGSCVWMAIAMGIFHLKLLHAITCPLHSFLTKGFKITVYSDGEMRLPRFSLYKVRGEITMIFFALSAIWHCFAWPNPMSALQWDFSVRPQVNFKPQMSLVAKSHSAPQLSPASCSNQITITRSQSDTAQRKMGAKVDLGVDIRLKNVILDAILTAYEAVINSLSLASEFAASMLGCEFIPR